MILHRSLSGWEHFVLWDKLLMGHRAKSLAILLIRTYSVVIQV